MLGCRARVSLALLTSTLLTVSATTSLGCSSTSSISSKPEPEAPVWDAAPTTLVVYDGRSATLPIAIRTTDPSAVAVTAATDGAEVEVVASDAASTDGLWHGTLRVRPGYALPAGDATVVNIAVVDGAGQSVAYPITLDVRKLGWQKRLTWDASGPQTREHGAFLYDHKAQAAYLLQGSGYSPQFQPIEDSWRLDLASGAWAPWAPTGDVPVAGTSRRAASVPGTQKFYLYGGTIGFEAASKDDGDLYLVDLADQSRTFTRLDSVGAGYARSLHAVAYDAKVDELLVFGGFAARSNDALDDTWSVKVAGTTATWTQLKTARAPSPRYGSFTAFDAESRRLVVWSGGQQAESQDDPVNAAEDGWVLDRAVEPPTWTKLKATGEAPAGRRNGCSMHDPVGRRLFVYGGTSDGKTGQKGLYVLDLEPGHEAWTKLDLPNTPPLRSSGFGFSTEDGTVTCAFGNDKGAFADVAFLGYADSPR